MKAALALLLIAASASAETLPSTSGSLILAPVVHPLPDMSRSLHMADYVRFGGIAAYRALDWQTTNTAIRIGCHERILPQSIANSPGRLAAFETGAAVGQMAGSAFLIHHGHRKLAQAIDWVSIGAGMLTVSSNEHYIHDRESAISKLVEVGK